MLKDADASVARLIRNVRLCVVERLPLVHDHERDQHCVQARDHSDHSGYARTGACARLVLERSLREQCQSERHEKTRGHEPEEEDERRQTSEPVDEPAHGTVTSVAGRGISRGLSAGSRPCGP